VNTLTETVSETKHHIPFETIASEKLTPVRKSAIDTFNNIGFPTSKDEDWKYLDLSPIKNTPFNHRAAACTNLTASEIEKYKIAGTDAVTLVFVNGVYCAELSTPHKADTFSIEFIETDNALQWFGKLAATEHQPFIALNTAFHHEGLFIHIKKGMEVKQTIHLLHLNDARQEAVAAHPRNLVVAENNSKVQIIATYHSLNHFPSLTNSVIEFFVGENAFVEYDVKQDENEKALQINQVYAQQKRNSVFDISTVTIGGKLVRNNLHIELAEPGCTAHLNGLTVAGENQTVDNHTLVDHASPNCESFQLYKNILDDDAHGVFNGKIFVRQDAQKTNAFQSSKNVLLSDNAVMNAKPQLEIYADDVKCSHGATTGQLDEEALFYFRSRGIGKKDALALLNYAFAGDVIEKINNDAMKADLLKQLAQKLRTDIEFEV
jgi:Fe-S cluster assembly protein SufD